MKHAQNRWCTSSICEQSLGKVWIKKNKKFWSYRLHKLGTSKHCWRKKCLSSTPLKNEKKIMKRAQNRRCTSSICVQSLGKVWIKKNEKFWSYRLHKLGTLKCFGRTDRRTDGRPDGRSGPTTRPAFAKATQVKIHYALLSGGLIWMRSCSYPSVKTCVSGVHNTWFDWDIRKQTSSFTFLSGVLTRSKLKSWKQKPANLVFFFQISILKNKSFSSQDNRAV